MRTFITFSLLLAALPAAAQDATVQPEDTAAMTQCVDAVATYLAENEDTDPASPVPAGTIEAPHRLQDCIGAASDPCMDAPGGYSTIGMTECLARETDWWDAELNGDFATLRDGLDAESFEALQAAQRTWIDWRDAKCEFEYTAWRDGTIRSTFYGSCMLEVTARRAIDLKSYLEWT